MFFFLLLLLRRFIISTGPLSRYTSLKHTHSYSCFFSFVSNPISPHKLKCSEWIHTLNAVPCRKRIFHAYAIAIPVNYAICTPISNFLISVFLRVGFFPRSSAPGHYVYRFVYFITTGNSQLEIVRRKSGVLNFLPRHIFFSVFFCFFLRLSGRRRVWLISGLTSLHPDTTVFFSTIVTQTLDGKGSFVEEKEASVRLIKLTRPSSASHTFKPLFRVLRFFNTFFGECSKLILTAC